ncbi:hypothetical protein Sango_2676000 [Sesamum angolense]|uniref:Uncharacterized protein n=1 Tax=Sesamum angolense TaxID=2727404 RepID=A0AAE2BHH9_9LAMI|nr:hypothetical protein Sango_2676000 [Sesamum angolense]
MNVNESENIPVNESVNVNVNENESENLNVNESENLNVNESENVNVNVNCNESENITGGLRDKGKKKLYEQYLNESSSEFDDSSDEDYVQPIIDGDSDTPSLVLEDIEVESDDDIFSNKNPTNWNLGLGTSKWSFISNRQGSNRSIEELVPDSEHRFCTRHMYQNFKQKFKFVELKEYFWKAASTANKQDFERYMKKIQEIDPKVSEDVETASEWLEKVNPEHWVRAFFLVHSKSDILVNNLCESFNSYILEARDKPIISMFEWIRTKLMMRLQQKREGMEKEIFLKRSLKDLRHLLQAKNKLLNKLERGILRTTPLQDKKEENMFLSESLQLQGKRLPTKGQLVWLGALVLFWDLKLSNPETIVNEKS